MLTSFKKILQRRLLILFFVAGIVFAGNALGSIKSFCGFVHDLPSTLVGAGASVVWSPRHYDSPSLKIVYNGTDSTYFKLLAPDGTTGSFVGFGAETIAFSGYLRLDAWANCEVLSITDGTNPVATLRTRTDGKLELRDVNNVAIDTGTTVLALDTWYYIQLTIYYGATGTYALLIDLESEFSGTGDFEAAQLDDVRFGVFTPAGSSALTFYWANVSVDDTAVPATGQRILLYDPDGNGTYTEFTGDFDEVDDDPSDGDTTVATAVTAGMRLTVTTYGTTLPITMDLSNTTTILATEARAIVKAASGTVTGRVMYRSGTTDLQTASVHTVGTDWTQVGLVRTTDPATDSTWTADGITAAEVGVRRASGSAGVNIICTSIWMEVLVAADDYIIPQQTGTTAIAFTADPHGSGLSIARTHFLRCLNWMETQGNFPKALCIAGDLTEYPDNPNPFHSWIRDPGGGDLDASIDLVVAPGNWDSDEPPSSENFGLIAANPFSTFKAAYSELFGDNEYTYWDYESVVRVVAFNDISDYTQDDGTSAYFNCNPPGDSLGTNPDHSGITISDSALRQYLDSIFDNQSPRWRIAMAHRSLWAPYDTDPRKLNRAARLAMQTPIDNGLFLLVTGDIHVGSLSGPWYPAGGVADTSALYIEPGGIGTYSLTLSGGYVVRDVDETVLPNHATTCAWASGGAETKKAQIAIIVFDNDGNTADIVIFEVSDSDLYGSVVYTGTLYRNVAGDATGGKRLIIDNNEILNGAILHN